MLVYDREGGTYLCVTMQPEHLLPRTLCVPPDWCVRKRLLTEASPGAMCRCKDEDDPPDSDEGDF
jgi:hypothetical protein